MTDFGGEGGWAPHSERPFEDGTNLYQKPTPKQDKESGHFMGYNVTLEGARHVLTNSVAGRYFAAPLRCFSVLYSLSTSGKPAFGVKGKVERNLAQPLATRP